MKKKNTLIWFLFLCFGATLFAQNLPLVKEKEINSSPGKKLVIESKAADIKVKSWSGNSVSVKIYANKKAQKECEFFIDEKSYGVFVEVKKKGFNLLNIFNNVSILIEVNVPSEYVADLKSSGGDITVYDLDGKKDIETSGGDIRVKNSSGFANCNTSGGDIEVYEHKGNLRLDTSGGDIKVNKVDGEINAETSGGDIEISSNNGYIKAETSGGDITVKYWGKNEGISLDTSGGDIHVYVNKDVKADVDLSTTGGDCDLEFSNANVSKSKSHQIIAKLNGGGKKIECSTSGGDVNLKELR